MRINKENLKDSGYKFYHPNDKYCKGLWQKTVRNGAAKEYFINIYLWQFPDNTTGSASSEVMFYRTDSLTDSKETRFQVELQLGVTSTIESMEKFYSEIYHQMKCIPDLHNNDKYYE